MSNVAVCFLFVAQHTCNTHTTQTQHLHSVRHSWAASAANLLTNAASSIAAAGKQATAERAAPSPPPSYRRSPPRQYEERYQRSREFERRYDAPYQGVQDDGSSFQWLVLLGSFVAIPTVVASEISIASTGRRVGYMQLLVYLLVFPRFPHPCSFPLFFSPCGFPLVTSLKSPLLTACCGLPRGPFGLLGGLEAVSYLTILTVLGWSAYRRLVRGAPGLPPGPLGLLPVAEGLSYATAIGFLFVISVQILGNGWVPGALAPQSPCF